MKKKKVIGRVMSALVCLALLLSYLPSIMFTATASAFGTRTVDPNTMEGWEKLFGSDMKTTQNAGGVWMDKSVFTDAESFPDNTVTMTDPDNNFLVALSALAANKEIVGYSTIPTDTMLVLDVSGSMEGREEELVIAANRAIETLLNTNKNNRVGVVLYSGSSTTGEVTYAQGTSVLLPLDRYTTTKTGTVNIGTWNRPNNISVSYFLELDNSTIEVSSSLRNSSNASISASKGVVGGTYIQAGLYAALKEFESASTVVESNNFQAGQKRLPILVLMSDGSPTVGTHNFAEVDKEYTRRVTTQQGGNRPGGNNQQTTETGTWSTAGRGNGTTDSLGFLTQLTASYVINRMEEHYDREGLGLFYTLGLGVGNDAVAQSVLDPANSTDGINTLWESYLKLEDQTALEISVPNPRENNSTSRLSVYKNADAVVQNYVDEYFSASDESDLIDAFDDIVEQIILQSRYYATNLEGGNPDFSGYITFEDIIGEYMEVKEIKGILLGDTYFDGHSLASKLNNSQDGGLGTIESPSALGLEFRDSVKIRLGIENNTDAFSLIGNAYRAGQLSYTDENNYSNYIGWYAKADGSYVGFYNEGTTTAPADAVYKIKSYGFLGQATGNIKDSDMMYMTVQVRTNIETGQQSVVWKIPAALVPMITYKISLDGNSIENATNIKMTTETADPIRLVFETGLRSDINELNVGNITDARYVAPDGSRVFWTNYWDISAPEHENHVTTTAGFTPSLQNERYYYTTDATVYQKAGNDYVEVTDGNHVIDVNGEYYHVRSVFRVVDDEGNAVVDSYYERISAVSLEKAKYGDGRWYIPIHTVFQYFTEYQVPKSANNTNSVIFSHYPYVTLTNASYEMDVKLGNNGKITVSPATGIKLSKTLDEMEPGASTAFRFRITLTAPNGTSLASSYPTVLAALDETSGTHGTATVTNGVMEVTLNAGQTLYITDLPAGTAYTIEEISDNFDYKVKNIHINGVAVAGTVATGTIVSRVLADVDFVNTPTSEGNLLISKTVRHPFGADYTIPANIDFDAKVTLTLGGAPLANTSLQVVTASGSGAKTTDANGQLTLTLKDGETVSIHGIPEETRYTVEEINLPNGFALDAAASSALSGTVSADANVHAQLVNGYTPDGVSANTKVSITKDFTGRDWKSGDSFTFVLEELHPVTRAVDDVIATVVIDDPSQLTKLFDLSSQRYTQVGTYHYRITETMGSATNGITYDTVERRFHVEVTDVDMDGTLEISSVDNVMNTVVSGDARNGFTVSATFANTYAPYRGSTVSIPVQKALTDNGHYFGLNGFKFGLFDETGTDLIHEFPLTDVNGSAVLRVAYSAADLGQHVYLLKEISTGISGMTYSDVSYKVVVTVTDNGDGTTSASYVVTDGAGGAVNGTPSFTNTYDPEDARTVISGTKHLDGRVQNEKEFFFLLYQADDSSFNIDGKTYLQRVGNAYNGSFVFDELVFDEAKEYYYVVVEEKGSLGGVTYSDVAHHVTVKVVLNSSTGKYEVQSVTLPNGGIVFNNVYRPAVATVQLSGTKILTGRDLKDGEFEFVATDAENNKIPVFNEGNTFTFPTFEFSTVGTYTYTVTETKGTAGGVTYDESSFLVTITVTDNGNGKLVATVAYSKDGVSSTGLSFRNTYAAASLDLSFAVEKDLDGRTQNAEEFKFELTNALTGKLLDTAFNAGNGIVTFDPVTVHAAGNYHYRISEVDTGLGGVTYDHGLYDILITVTDNGEGQLVESSRIIKKDGVDQNSSTVVFSNRYEVADAQLTFEGNKTLSGRPLEKGEFTFKIYETDATFALSAQAYDTVTNGEGGKFSFKPIVIDSETVRYFTVVEDASAKDPNITYDATEYHITVKPVDNGAGEYTVTTEIVKVKGTDSAEAETLLFANVFTPSPIRVNFSVTKVVDNKTTQQVSPEGFKFTLNGNGISETVTSGADGKAAFSAITYTSADLNKTYTYTVTEENTGVDGFVYSTEEATITVAITADEKGNLVASYTRNGESVDAVDVTFTNVYKGYENPSTSDNSTLWIWISLMVAGAAGVTVLCVLRKKAENRTEE